MKEILLSSFLVLFILDLLTGSTGCSKESFMCKEEECIFESWVCDGKVDCSNGKDEERCGHNCPKRSFGCSNGTCIDNTKVCDRKFDCPDGEDESSCETGCYNVEFKCTDGQCLRSHTLRCDGIPDCLDGSDEVECDLLAVSTACSKGSFMCNEKECIFESWVCDGKVDCSNGKDEERCGHNCPKRSFGCSNGTCIDNTKVCDRKLDCPDGEDESSCGTDCYSVEFKCTDGQCLPSHSLRCDGKADCLDGTDEVECDKKIECSQEHFTCSNGTCIKKSWVCDGVPDCSDGSDEKSCSVPSTCASDETTCFDGTCAPSRFRCFFPGETTTVASISRSQSISSDSSAAEADSNGCVLGQGCLVKVMGIVLGVLAFLTLALGGSFCFRYRKKTMAGESSYLPLNRQRDMMNPSGESITMSNVL